MNNKDEERRLLGEIGEIEEKYVEEAEYSEKEVDRLRKQDMTPVVPPTGKNDGSGDETVVEFGKNETDRAERAKERRRTVMIIRIVAEMAVAAAVILMALPVIKNWKPNQTGIISETTAPYVPSTGAVYETKTPVETKAPATEAPTTVAPATEAPTTVAPTTVEPTTEVPEEIYLSVDKTNFPDAMFRGYLLEKYDLDKDQHFSAEEIRNIKTVELAYLHVTSLKGVEYLTSLQVLNCGDGDFAELDVSKNVELRELSVSAGLKELDVSHNPALRMLDVMGNQLTSLDVSANPNLTGLGCEDNLLTELDISANRKLQELNCSRNQLTTLNLSANTKLQRLLCHTNQLTVLDISAQPDLIHINCAYNQFTSLDLSMNTKLETLYCFSNQLTTLKVENCPKLIVLLCDTNQLSSLNLSGNPNIESIQCQNNFLTSLDLSVNVKLSNLWCYGNQLTSVNVAANTALTTLRCDSKVKVTGAGSALEIIRH